MFYLKSGAKIIGDVKIGNNSSIWYNSVLRGDNGSITIGENTNIQDCCVCHASPNYEVKIGNNVTIGHNAIIHGCTIENECLIGMGAIIMNGTHISKNCLIGAGSLILENTYFEEGVLIVGSPAKVKRKLTSEEIERIKTSATNYIALAQLEFD